AWTVLLAVFTFSLSLLGTFLVRSGVLTSVHAFATDPERGVFILFFLAVVVGGSLLLYSWRAPMIRSATRLNIMSREGGLLINNVLLVIAAASVLLGTLYPLALDALGLGKISVGPPYFNSVFIPITIPIAVLVGIGIMARWKQDALARIGRQVVMILVMSIALGVMVPLLLLEDVTLGAIIGVTLAFWVSLASGQNIYDRVKDKQHKFAALMAIPRGFYGMSFAHFGIAIFIVGVTLTSIYSQEKDVRLVAGQSYAMGDYEFHFKGVTEKTGPNYRASEGDFIAMYKGEEVAQLYTQKRLYNAGGMPMTEAGIDAGLFRDLYVSLGEPLDDQGAWSVRLYYKPFVRWIWLGALFMGFGGLLAATDRRYRQMVKAEQPANAVAAGAA
ncbi:MAG: c-type cytochrome biogenesis protein CcmF, partial [Gammaproteobacteria bacterium]|nr:c-type cytochrome biogenesis protein CcmF [Gammaproteobacteria bacterium]